MLIAAFWALVLLLFLGASLLGRRLGLAGIPAAAGRPL